jgi:hypothetical protein
MVFSCFLRSWLDRSLLPELPTPSSSSSELSSDNDADDELPDEDDSSELDFPAAFFNFRPFWAPSLSLVFLPFFDLAFFWDRLTLWRMSPRSSLRPFFFLVELSPVSFSVLLTRDLSALSRSFSSSESLRAFSSNFLPVITFG